MSPDVPTSIPAFMCAWLYGPRGQTLVGRLRVPAGSFQDVLSKPGSASLTAMLDTVGAQVGDRAVIKFSVNGQMLPFGAQVRLERSPAVDGARLLYLDNLTGLFGALNEGVVFPEYGMDRAAGDQRTFGWMSAALGWYIGGDWDHAVGTVWNTAGNAHGSYPTDFKAADPLAEWITAPSLTSPDTTSPDHQVVYGRGSVEITTATNAEVLFAADNLGELWHNGENILQWQRMDFRNAARIQLTLDAGSHLFAFKAQNVAQPAAYAGDPNPVAGIFTLYPVDKKGNKDGAVLLRSDTSWVMNDNTHPPGWHRGQIARVVFDEAVSRGALGPLALSRTFSETLDSNGDAWTDAVVNLPFPVGSMGVADVITELAQVGIDAWVDARDMTFNVANHKGTDKTGTVSLTLGSDLVADETTKTFARVTAIPVHLGNGEWREVTDAAGLVSPGRIEAGVSVGASTDETVIVQAQHILRNTAADLVTSSIENAVTRGPQMYADCGHGDWVTTTGHRGTGTMSVRLLSITGVFGEPHRLYADTVVADTPPA